MSNQKIIFAGFILMVLAQLFVPANMIWQEESVITEGTEFHFKVEPVDPNDPFRGKYIRLAFEANRFTVPGNDWNTYGKIYVSIQKGADGFAQIQDISSQPPLETADFIEAEVYTIRKKQDSTEITVAYPFDRYYMEESKALPAEELFRETIGDSTSVTYGVLYVKMGKATLTDIRINEVSIQDAVGQ